MRALMITFLALTISLITAATAMDQEEDLATAAAVWEESSGYKSWQLVPGTTEKMPGQAPHGKEVTIYANQLALEAMQANLSSMPDGGVLLKENFGLTNNLMMITAMKKVEGIWFWAVYKSDGTVVKAGDIKGCNACHQHAKRDGVFTWDAD